MLRKLLNKIESKRSSKSIFWRILVNLKDFGWLLFYYTEKTFREIWYFLIKDKIHKKKFAKVKGRNLKILYLYGKKDWAIHNVGKLWLNGIPFVDVDFKEFKGILRKEFYNYDLVWYGSLNLFLEKPFSIKKSIVTIHDPIEVFSIITEKNARLEKEERKKLKILKRLENKITISKEMNRLLEERGIKTYMIQTTSILPKIKQIKKNCIKICSVFKDHPRKNPQLMNFLKQYTKKELGVKFDIKEGFNYLSEKEYIKYLDEHGVYICTSYKEGGPLPAMDAMKRGLVVLTTPVGQIQEFIENGKNGFICKTKEEFIKQIKFLLKNKREMHKMRIESRKTILKSRNIEDINSEVNNFLKKFLDSSTKEMDWNKRIKKSRLFSIFKEIYDKNIWGCGSGSGSSSEYTHEYRKFFEKFIKDYKIKSVVDAGCGDWQFSRLIDWRGIDYQGIDIVHSVISKNNKKYGRKNIRFYCKDILSSKLPRANLIIIKDVLQHLSNEKVLKFIKNLKNYKYSLIINDFCNQNTDCLNGRYRPINPNEYPFNLDSKLIFRFGDKAVFLKET